MKIEYIQKLVFDIGNLDEPKVRRLLVNKNWTELRVELERINTNQRRDINPNSIVILEQTSFKEVN